MSGRLFRSLSAVIRLFLPQQKSKIQPETIIQKPKSKSVDSETIISQRNKIVSDSARRKSSHESSKKTGSLRLDIPKRGKKLTKSQMLDSWFQNNTSKLRRHIEKKIDGLYRENKSDVDGNRQTLDTLHEYRFDFFMFCMFCHVSKKNNIL